MKKCKSGLKRKERNECGQGVRDSRDGETHRVDNALVENARNKVVANALDLSAWSAKEELKRGNTSMRRYRGTMTPASR